MIAFTVISYGLIIFVSISKILLKYLQRNVFIRNKSALSFCYLHQYDYHLVDSTVCIFCLSHHSIFVFLHFSLEC